VIKHFIGAAFMPLGVVIAAIAFMPLAKGMSQLGLNEHAAQILSFEFPMLVVYIFFRIGQSIQGAKNRAEIAETILILFAFGAAYFQFR